VPTYEYACSDCSIEFEVFQAFSDEALKSCEKCGGSVRKIYNNVGVVFKGSGFYKTDSRKSAETQSSVPKSEGKSESKVGESSSKKPVIAKEGSAPSKD
jgi:putative FmdB family regulatory protein